MTDELVRLTARDGAVKTTPVVAAEPEPDAPVDPLRAPVAGIGDNSAVTIDEELKRLARK